PRSTSEIVDRGSEACAVKRAADSRAAVADADATERVHGRRTSPRRIRWRRESRLQRHSLAPARAGARGERAPPRPGTGPERRRLAQSVNLSRHDGSIARQGLVAPRDRKSTRLNSSHVKSSYAVLCLKKRTVRGT